MFAVLYGMLRLLYTCLMWICGLALFVWRLTVNIGTEHTLSIGWYDVVRLVHHTLTVVRDDEQRKSDHSQQ